MINSFFWDGGMRVDEDADGEVLWLVMGFRLWKACVRRRRPLEREHVNIL